jgi:hypothetical protein
MYDILSDPRRVAFRPEVFQAFICGLGVVVVGVVVVVVGVVGTFIRESRQR